MVASESVYILKCRTNQNSLSKKEPIRVVYLLYFTVTKTSLDLVHFNEQTHVLHCMKGRQLKKLIQNEYNVYLDIYTMNSY